MTSAKRWLNCLHVSQLAVSFALCQMSESREGWQEETAGPCAPEVERSGGGGCVVFLVPQ